MYAIRSYYGEGDVLPHSAADDQVAGGGGRSGERQQIANVRQQMRALIARSLRIDMVQCYDGLHSIEPYRYSAHEAGRRSLRNLCLAYLLAPTLEGELEPVITSYSIHYTKLYDP